MERFPRRILDALVLAIAVTVTYTWCVRICDDLLRDESVSWRRYASHPLRALALYKEPNNHPLESFYKSLFAAVPGLDRPAFYRFAGFVVLVGFLAAVLSWRKFLLARGAVLAATVATLLFFLARAIDDQALELRGYFPSILIEAVWFLLLARWSRLLERPSPGDAVGGGPGMTPRIRLAFAGLSAALLFTLPSNLALLVVLWPATALAFAPPAAGRARTAFVLREGGKLALLGGAFAAVLYLPILATVLFVTGRPRGIPRYPAEGSILDELAFAFRQCQPAGMNDWLFAGLLAALFAAALVVARRARPVKVAWLLLLGTLAVCGTIAAFFSYPPRIKSPFVAPVLFAIVFLVHEVASRWTARTQTFAAIVLAAASFGALPAVIRETRFDRRASDLAAFLETATRPGERRVLVAHDNADTLHLYLNETFGAGCTIDSLSAWRQEVGGVDPRAGRSVSALEKWVTEKLFPAPHVRRIDPADVDVLVLVGEKEQAGGAVQWKDPVLDALKSRLSRVSRYRRDLRDIEIYQAP